MSSINGNDVPKIPAVSVGIHSRFSAQLGLDHRIPSDIIPVMRVDTERMREEADAKLEAAKAEYVSDINAIKRIEMLAGKQPRGDSGKAIDRSKNADSGNGDAPVRVRVWAGMGHAIEYALMSHPNGAMLKDIERTISTVFAGKHVTRQQVSRAITRMLNSDPQKIRAIRKQKGSIPALYALSEKEVEVTKAG